MKTKKLTVLAIAICLALTTVFAGAESVFGATAMPADKTVSVPEGVTTYFTYGNDYDYTSFYYYKIQPKKTGYIYFHPEYSGTTNAVLCNANKKVISTENISYGDFLSGDSSYDYQRFVCYGVQKGKTYYVRLKGAPSYRQNQDYNLPYYGGIYWKNYGVKSAKYGTTKKKAKALTRNKWHKGVIIAGSQKAKWYKIVSNKKKIKVSISSKYNNGTIKATVYYKSYDNWYTYPLNAYRGTDSYRRTGTITSNKKKNVYYVKVQPKGKCSGYYQLKWK